MTRCYAVPVMRWLKKFLLLPTRVPTRYLIVAVFVCAGLLFLPNELADNLGTGTLRDEYRTPIGVFLLVAVGSSIAKAWLGTVKVVQRNRWRRQVLGCLDSLSNDEGALLALCLRRGQPTIHLAPINHIVKELLRKGIVVQNSGSAEALKWPFIIRTFVWRKLLSRREEFLADRDADDDEATVFPRRY